MLYQNLKYKKNLQFMVINKPVAYPGRNTHLVWLSMTHAELFEMSPKIHFNSD